MNCLSWVALHSMAHSFTELDKVAVWHWSDFEEIPHVQGQGRSPSKTVGGAK